MEKLDSYKNEEISCKEEENNNSRMLHKQRTKFSLISFLLNLVGIETKFPTNLIVLGFCDKNGCLEPIRSKDQMKLIVSRFIWITYRKNFKPIDGFTSDSGWGCMIRVAQMMLATAISRVILYECQTHLTQKLCESENLCAEESKSSCLCKFSQLTGFECNLALKQCDCIDTHVIGLFLEDRFPFGFSYLIEVGKEILNKGAGEWYGAHSISQVIKEASDRFNAEQPTNIKILTFNEGVVYKNDINLYENCETSLLVIIPLRLGLNKVDETFFPQIKSILIHELSVGILGGKSNSAMYYIGYSSSSMIALDPHTTQRSVEDMNEEDISTYHTNSPRLISLQNIDTTMAFCFYIKDSSECETFINSIENWKEEYPEDYLIGIREKREEINYDLVGEIDDDFEII